MLYSITYTPFGTKSLFNKKTWLFNFDIQEQKEHLNWVQNTLRFTVKSRRSSCTLFTKNAVSKKTILVKNLLKIILVDPNLGDISRDDLMDMFLLNDEK